MRKYASTRVYRRCTRVHVWQEPMKRFTTDASSIEGIPGVALRQCPDWIPHLPLFPTADSNTNRVRIGAPALEYARQCQVFSQPTVNTNSRG